MADESWSKVRLPDHTARLVGEYKGIFGKEASAESSLKRKEAAIDLSKDGFETTGIFGPPQDIVAAVADKLKEGKSNGYFQSHGAPPVKRAVAKKFSVPGHPLQESDALITVGAVHALDIAIGVLCDVGQNILVPSPGSYLYTLLPKMRDVEVKKYRLKSNENFCIDTHHLASLIDDKTTAILVSNPSIPMGTLHSEEDLKRVLAVAEEHFIPIISDEMFRVVPHPGSTSIQIASLTDTVPVLECGGLDTYIQCDGWKVGWIVVHDRQEAFAKEVLPGLVNLCTRLIGAPSFTQSVVPLVMETDLTDYHRQSGSVLKENASYVCSQLSEVKGLSPIQPRSGLFVMVKIDFDHFPQFSSDKEFVDKLLSSCSVNCASGTDVSVYVYVMCLCVLLLCL
jgi:tyrosine aminotransferase